MYLPPSCSCSLQYWPVVAIGRQSLGVHLSFLPNSSRTGHKTDHLSLLRLLPVFPRLRASFREPFAYSCRRP